MSRICEEFGVPLVDGPAIDQPLLETSHIIRMRNYKRAIEIVEDTSIPSDKVPSAVADLVGNVKAIVEYQDALRRFYAEEDASQ